jgi:hypothetical protein
MGNQLAWTGIIGTICVQANAWILNMMFFLFQFLHMILPVEHYLQDLSDLEYDSR